MRRRNFLRLGIFSGAGLFLGCAGTNRDEQDSEGEFRMKPTEPLVISTWKHGLAANREAWRILDAGGSAMDAAVQGVMVTEADEAITSVGYGGYPNRDGVVELDAAVMDGNTLEGGAVAGLQRIKHPVAVARQVMDETPHVMLVGAGAHKFARSKGHADENLLTEKARNAWEKRWGSGAAPKIDEDNHDTIGMIVLDGNGTVAASCTTSGAAWKLPGRVGDSPIIGAGLYCDSSVGGATATGLGEEVVKVCGSYQVVEFMRQGMEPQAAIERTLHRIIRRNAPNRPPYVGFVAVRSDGLVGYAATDKGFQAAVSKKAEPELHDAPLIH